MDGRFDLRLLTPERTVLETKVVSIIAPGSEGYLGILANHAPLITALVPGKLTIRESDTRGAGEFVFAISGGFLEVSNNSATILADAIEPPEKIDLDRAKRARERAQERLRDMSGKIDAVRAEAALKRALNRIKIAGGR